MEHGDRGARSSSELAQWLTLVVTMTLTGLFAFWAMAADETAPEGQGKRPKRFLELRLTPTPTPTPTPPPTPSPAELRAGEEARRKVMEAEAQRVFDVAVDYIKRGRNDQAKKHLQQIVQDFPQTTLAPNALFQMAEIETDLAEADKTLAQLILNYPKSEWTVPAWYKRGEVNMLLWDYGNALKMFEQYLEKNPRGERAGIVRRQMAICLLNLGEPDKALAELQRLNQEQPDIMREPASLETLAECHVELDNSGRALPILELLAKKHPTYANYTRVFLLYGLVLEDTNQFQSAIDVYSKLVERFPRSTEASIAQARLDDLEKPLTLGGRTTVSTPTLELESDVATPTLETEVATTTPTLEVEGPGTTPTLPVEAEGTTPTLEVEDNGSTPTLEPENEETTSTVEADTDATTPTLEGNDSPTTPVEPAKP